MAEPGFTLSPYAYMLDLFASQAARSGGILRRKVRDIEHFVGRGPFLDEMRRRGFPVFENSEQFVVFCNIEPIRRVA